MGRQEAEGAGATLVSEPEGPAAGSEWMAMVGLVAVVTVVAFEAMAVATALPTAARHLHGLAHYSWAFAGFLVAEIVGMVTSGLVSDRRGPKPVLIVGLAGFCAGLLVTGLAPGMAQFVVGRVIQGLAAGLLLTSVYVTIGERFPEQRRGKMMAAVSSAWVVPSLVGPVISGAVTQHAGWRWVFLGLAPLVAVAAVLLAPYLVRQSAALRAEGRPVAWSRLLRAVVLAASLAGLVQAGQDPSTVVWILLPFAVAGAGWSLFGLMPPGTARLSRGVPATVGIFALLAGAVYGAQSFVPLALTLQHGYDPTDSGLPLLGSAVLWAAGAWWQGRDAMAAHRPSLVRVGCALVAIAAAGTAVASTTSVPGWLAYLAWPVVGLGAGLALSSLTVLMLGFTTDADRGRDSSSTQLGDAVISALATGFGGLLVASASHGHLAYDTAFLTIGLTMSVLAAGGVVAAGRTRSGP